MSYSTHARWVIRPMPDELQCRTKVCGRNTKFSWFRVSTLSTIWLPPHHIIMQRTSLAIINDNRAHNHELSPYQRGLIVRASLTGASSGEVARIFNFNKFTVQATLKKFITRHNEESKPRSERSQLLIDRDRRYIIKHARLNPRLTYSQLKSEADLTCSRTIVYRALKEYDLINWLIKKRPLLTPEMTKKRYDWCYQRREWTFEKWAKIIWSNECFIEKKSRKQRQWVFKFSKKMWNKKMIQSVLKDKRVSVMIWATFWEEERSDLYKLTRDFEFKKMSYFANSYLEILKNNLLEIWKSHFIFMQNNALIYKIKKMMKWFEDNDIMIIDWSFYSLDLNLIEHLWYLLKQLVYQINSDIDSMTVSENIVREILWKTLKKIWTLIDEKIMRVLIESMKRRIKTVIAAEEWYIKYWRFNISWNWSIVCQ